MSAAKVRNAGRLWLGRLHSQNCGLRHRHRRTRWHTQPPDAQPKAYYASLLHDVLYQFLDCGLPLTRAQVDRIFLEILTRDGFAPRWLYYVLVRIFGGGFRLFTRWKRGQIGSCVMLATTPAP